MREEASAEPLHTILKQGNGLYSFLFQMVAEII